MARQGKWAVAQQMLDEMETEAEETSANAEFKKRKKAAEESLRREGEIDQGVLAAAMMGLGPTTAARAGRYQQQAAWQPQQQGYQGPPPGSYAGAPRVAAPTMPAAQPGQQQPVPRPPPMPQGQGQGGRKERFRTKFMAAEEALQNGKCPASLHGHMVPVGMRFFTPGKTLEDPPKVRAVPFTDKCKLCDRVGHEAFECSEVFQFQGRPACNYRQLFAMGVLDKNGMVR